MRSAELRPEPPHVGCYGLKWERHEGVAMKGFPGKFTLWAVAG